MLIWRYNTKIQYSALSRCAGQVSSVARARIANRNHNTMSNPMFPWGCQSLSECDPEVKALIEKEKNRQWRGLELIASEVCPGPRRSRIVDASCPPKAFRTAPGHVGAAPDSPGLDLTWPAVYTSGPADLHCDLGLRPLSLTYARTLRMHVS